MPENKDLVTALQQLLEKTMKRIDPQMSKAVIADIIKETISDVKITKENLSPELISELGATRTVQVMPDIKPTAGFQPQQGLGISQDEPILQKVIDDLLLGNNVWLYGAAGTGKTFMAKLAANIIGKMKGRKIPNWISVACNQYTAPSVFLGGQTIDGYREGKLINAWKTGKVFILDELPKLDPNTAGVLNEALAAIDDPDPIISSNEVTKEGEALQYRMHPDFCVIATGNTTGKGVSSVYGGNFQQDLSLIDRFSGNYYEISFNDKRDKTLVSPVVFEFCVGVRKVLLDTKAEEIMTLRTMIHFDKVYNLEMQRILHIGGAEPIANGKTFEDAVESMLKTMETDTAEKVRAVAIIKVLADKNKPEEIKQADADGYIKLNTAAFMNKYRDAYLYNYYLKTKIQRTSAEEEYLKRNKLI